MTQSIVYKCVVRRTRSCQRPSKALCARGSGGHGGEQVSTLIEQGFSALALLSFLKQIVPCVAVLCSVESEQQPWPLPSIASIDNKNVAGHGMQNHLQLRNFGRDEKLQLSFYSKWLLRLHL